MIRRPNYSQLDRKKDIYFLASGGRDSTAMVLEAHALGIKGTMTFNFTHYNGKGIKVLKRLQETTGYSLKIVKYDGDEKPSDILRSSFMRVPEAIADMKDKGRFNKRFFRCCVELKEKPNTRLIKSLDPDNAVLIMGLKAGDGAKNRRLRMLELRQRGTFYRKHKANGLLYYYPLRDCHKTDIDNILDEWQYSDIPSTGCNICPVFCMFDSLRKKDPLTWLRSVTYARKLGIDFPHAAQTTINQFCKG